MNPSQPRMYMRGSIGPDPAQELLSPYGTHLINSYCHAWSWTPAIFLRGISTSK